MHQRSVLVVEDEENIQQTLTIVLTLVGFKTYSAGNVEEALTILRREHIDALSLDIRMPDPKGLDRDGLTLLKYLRSVPAYAQVPVLLFTGVLLEPDVEATAARLGAKVFLKPQSYDDVIEELNRRLPPDQPAAG